MFTLEWFRKNYETETKEAVIKGRPFRFFVPRSLERFMDPEDVLRDFPLWAKIWEASVILADYLAGAPVEPGKRYLEIGCGVGLVGIVAAGFGHCVTMTEYSQDALNFARANAASNLPPGNSNLVIETLDWNRPQLKGAFDCILGSEVVYKENDFQTLLSLFRTYLKPGGEIILAEGLRKTSVEFFRQMQMFFDIRAQKKLLRSKNEEVKVLLARMIFKARNTISPVQEES